jgi:acetylglutamate kinase
MELHIIKIGGKVVDNEIMLQEILRGFIADNRPKILVHGGGKGATELAEKLGIPTQMVNGRRITDDPTLEIAVMVYAGWFNKKVVAALQAGGCNALGLSGADGNLILAHKRPVGEIDYGWVGDVDSVDAEGIRELLLARFTPVLCAITHDGQGHLLNTNADTIAFKVAQAMSKHYKVTLSYCFEKSGVLLDAEDNTTLIPRLDRERFEALKKEGAIHTGMLPKLENAFAAAAAGVETVRICGPDTFSGNGGTLIY